MASPTGGHEYELVQPSPDSLECSVCLQVLRDPHITSCCGHHFCHSCIAGIQNSNKPCPLCNERGFTTLLNKAVAREVNALLVYCPLKSRGCDWQGELGRVEQHLNDCGIILSDCKYQCGERLEHWLIAKHEFEDCPRRPIEVQMAFLMQRMDTQAKEIKHLKEENSTKQAEIQNLKEENSTSQAEVQMLKQQVARIPSPPIPPFYYSISNYKYMKANGLNQHSPPFYSHPGGYKLQLVVWTDGFHSGKGTHLSLYVNVLRGKFDDQLWWPFRGRVTVEMFNFNYNKWSYAQIIDFSEYPCDRVMDLYGDGSYGYYAYITNTLLWNKYLLDGDVMRFKVLKVDL